jgi:capsular exopolysaccharide synthesis family protein
MTMTAYPEQSAAPAGLTIKDYLELLRRRRVIFLNVFVIVLVAGVLMAASAKPVYQTSASLLIPNSARSWSLVDSSNPIEAMLAAAQPDNVATQIEVLQSGFFIADAWKAAGIVDKPGVAGPSARVRQRRESNVVDVTVEGGDPHDVAQLANTIVDLHLQRTDLLRTTGLQDTTEFVQQEKEKAARELATAEQRLLAFRRDHRVAELTADQEARTREYVALQTRVSETASNITSFKAQLAEVRSRLAKEPIDLVRASTKENPRVARLQEKLDAAQFQRMELARQFQPGNRQVRDLDAQIAALQQQLTAEPETLPVRTHEPNPARLPLQARLAELETGLQGQIAAHNGAVAEFQTKKRAVDDIGPWEVQQAHLVNERDASQSAYNSLSNHLRDLEIRSKARARTARVLQRASVPTIPIRPRKARSVTLAAVLALLLAAGCALLQEHLDDRVNSPEDVERVVALPSLGHVPVMANGQAPLIAEMPTRSHVADAYRSLRSSISFAAVDAPLRRLVVTSANKGEGKSVTSVNLATAMAAEGKRVILVDADMRRPSTHRYLDLPLAPGLSEVLAGMNTVDAVLQPTSIPNLQAICAGPIPPNPTELLGSSAFDKLLAHLEDRADVVLFDTPPCVPVIDPVILAGRVDGVVLVVHSGETRRGAVKHAVELLGRAHARIVGVVFNRVRPDQGGYYYYHYYADAETGTEKRRRSRHKSNGHEVKAELQEAVALAGGERDQQGRN